MSGRKQRVTVTVDDDLLATASAAVERGDATSVSAWVNDAMAQRRRRDELLTNLRTSVAEYEAAHGEITAAEMAAQADADDKAGVGAGRARRRRRTARSA